VLAQRRGSPTSRANHYPAHVYHHAPGPLIGICQGAYHHVPWEAIGVTTVIQVASGDVRGTHVQSRAGHTSRNDLPDLTSRERIMSAEAHWNVRETSWRARDRIPSGPLEVNNLPAARIPVYLYGSYRHPVHP